MQVRRSRVEHIEEELNKDPESEFYLVEQQFVKGVCSKHESIGSSHSSSGTDSHRRRKRGSGSNNSSTVSDNSGHIGANGDLELTGEMLHHYLADLGTPCEDMLLRCHFEGRYVTNVYLCCVMLKHCSSDFVVLDSLTVPISLFLRSRMRDSAALLI